MHILLDKPYRANLVIQQQLFLRYFYKVNYSVHHVFALTLAYYRFEVLFYALDLFFSSDIIIMVVVVVVHAGALRSQSRIDLAKFVFEQKLIRFVMS